MKRPFVALFALAVVSAGVSYGVAGCTETPSDLPECVGPDSYCPSLDGGFDATDAAQGIDATPDAEIGDAQGASFPDGDAANGD